MGHVLFIFLHLIALIFGAVLLFVTIPLHVIYAVVSKPKIVGQQPQTHDPRTHDLCPYCREPVHREASICPHCRQALTPESEATAGDIAVKTGAYTAQQAARETAGEARLNFSDPCSERWRQDVSKALQTSRIPAMESPGKHVFRER